MRYMILIYEPERDADQATAEIYDEYGRFTEDVQKRGLLRGADPLQPTSTATTVRVRNGNAMHTDGPFAETKEQLGGYYILDCKDLDEALDAAAKIPSARWGSIEVRPIREM